jgi:cellulose synthase/poly-beta-1,6-N-acetylglucosamine synthase-like glycosyltransferase
MPCNFSSHKNLRSASGFKTGIHGFFLFLLFSMNQVQALESIPIDPAHFSETLSDTPDAALNDKNDSEPIQIAPEQTQYLTLQNQEAMGAHSMLRPRNKESALLGLRTHLRSLYPPIKPFWIDLALYILLIVIALVLIYTIRHYLFTVNRLFGNQRHPYTDIETADWPKVTIFVPAHNEEAVIHHSLEALLDSDYPADRLQIIPVNDRSSDSTMQIIDDFVARNPGRIYPYHRNEGKPGKAAALKDAEQFASGEIFLVFDADYVPGRGLVRQLTAPFFDPEVGAVMGRVVPLNTGTNLLTRLLDLERSGGYQVDQQARMNLHLVPQYGGTVGGVRRAAFKDVGGWRDDSLAEDTDLTYRLLLNGWKTVYQNRSECYEESPEAWPVRVRQIMRWSKGHNQAAFRYAFGLVKSRSVRWGEKLDGILLLGVYAMSPILLIGWLMAIFLYYFSSNDWLSGTLAIFSLVAYSALGNFAAFFEIGAAVYLDGSHERLRLMPLNYLGFLVSLLSISRATINQILIDTVFRRKFQWQKTSRYRKSLAV